MEVSPEAVPPNKQAREHDEGGGASKLAALNQVASPCCQGDDRPSQQGRPGEVPKTQVLVIGDLSIVRMDRAVCCKDHDH